MAEWLKVIILGIVEGLTEFLPVSSTGHLIVAASALELNINPQGTFEIFIQFGTILAVVWYYRVNLWHQVKTARTDAHVRRLWGGIVIAFIPAGWLGFLFGNVIEATLFSPVIVGLSLIFGGFVFLIVESLPESTNGITTTELTDVRPRQALTIGLLQALALIPGMSRSGVSIIGGMLAGLDRQTATQFSFYLAIPTMGGAALYKLLTVINEISWDDLLFVGLGTAVSCIVAWLSIHWLLRYVERHNFIPFGIYRIVVGGIILLLVGFGNM